MTTFNPYSSCLPPNQILPFLCCYINGKPSKIDIPTANAVRHFEVGAEGPVHLVALSPNIPRNGARLLLLGDGKPVFDGTVLRGVPFSVEFTAAVISVVFESSDESLITSRAEEMVVKGVLEILVDEAINPRQGSLPSETVKALIRRRFPLRFDSVLSKHDGWDNFLAKHCMHFTTFRYSENELKSRGLLGQISSEEVRIVRNTANRLKLTFPNHSEVVAGKLTLSTAGAECFSLLHSPQLKTNLQKSCASFSLMMRFLQKHNQTFRWSTDPTQRTVIGLI